MTYEEHTMNICRTYTTTTPESAEQGDHDDHGFAGEHGERYSLFDAPVIAESNTEPDIYWEPVAPGDVANAIRWAREHGCTFDNGDGTFYGEDWEILDYGTGEDIQYAIHFNGFRPTTLGRIARAIAL